MKTLFRSKMRFVLIPIIAVAFVFLVAFLVMHLWNYTLPVLFGVGIINLWQAMALFLARSTNSSTSMPSTEAASARRCMTTS